MLSLFRSARRVEELDDEIRAHLELEEQENRDSGMAPDDARDAARRAFGNVTRTQEDSRNMWRFPSLENLLQDVRFGLRMLHKNPGFTAIAALTLALGIGANTAIFSLVNAVLLRPLPYQDPSRIMTLWQSVPQKGVAKGFVSPANFLDWRNSNDVYSGVVAITYWALDYTGRGEPESFTAELVSKDFFAMLGVHAEYGRTFTPEEYEPGQDKEIVLSHGFWLRQFGGDSGVVGSTISLSDKTYTIVGVLPADFTLPWLGRERELYSPLAFSPDERKLRGAAYLQVLARLKPGVNLDQAQSAMSSIAARLARDYPNEDSGVAINTVPLEDQIVGKVRPMLFVLLGSVGLVLLIGCVNIANLLLARGTSRQRELAIRIALGAERWRLVRQLLTESLLLGALGCAGGLLLARVSTRIIVASQPGNIPRLNSTTMDASVFIFAVAISLLTALLFGLVPAVHVTRSDVHETLKESGDRAGTARRGIGLRSALIVSEVALAVVLLVGAGLLLRSFVNLLSVNPGYVADRIVGLQVYVWNRYEKPEQRAAYFQQAVQNIAALPGVEAAGAASSLPLFLSGVNQLPFSIEGKPPLRADQQPAAIETVATPGFFAAMGVPLLRGRLLNNFDRSDSAPVVVINQTMAQTFWPGEDPVGQKISVPSLADNPTPPVKCEIVGVVTDTHQVGPERPPMPEYFRPHAQEPTGSMAFVVRTAADPMASVKSIETAIWQANKLIPFYDISTMKSLLETSWANRRFTLLMLAGFAALALTLAAVGIYGIVSYSTAQRTHEIGIRVALGAQRRDVLGMVLGQGMRLVLIGLAAGAAAAVVAARMLASLLFGVGVLDPATFLLVAALLTGVALLACYVPARRAMRVDPMVALRYE